MREYRLREARSGDPLVYNPKPVRGAWRVGLTCLMDSDVREEFRRKRPIFYRAAAHFRD